MFSVLFPVGCMVPSQVTVPVQLSSAEMSIFPVFCYWCVVSGQLDSTATMSRSFSLNLLMF